MPIQKVNDIDLYYEVHGDAKETLILIGGLTADHQVWKSTMRTFSQHFRVVIFDNRGAGQSSTPDYPYTTKMMADDVAGLMDALNIKKAHILGHSMGGCVVQQMAIAHPEKVDKLVIACSRAKPSHLSDMVLSMREKLIKAKLDDLLLTEYMMPLLFSEQFLSKVGNVKGFIQWTLKNPHPQSPIGFKQQLHAVITHNISDNINDIKADTLVIAGNEDCLMPPRLGEAFANELSQAQFTIIPESAHMPHVEQPKAFVDAVLSFIITT